ncbi:MAG: type IV secretory system conjugative DNA transfer family protein [Clostridia bacterium]|nr:type IV secretory system conjugative DNA transfer family protein [Clostridia bacterium]
MASSNGKLKASSFIMATIISYIIGLVVTYFVVLEGQASKVDISMLWDGTTIVVALVILGVYIIAKLLKFDANKASSSSARDVGKTKDGQKISQYADSRWVTEKELITESKFRYHLFKDLKNCRNDGIVIRSEQKGNALHINMYKPIHTLVIGTTGSGKTEGYVNPTIQILSSCASKPSMVITDPKGELYNKHARKCKNEGYEVKVLDLRSPYTSTRWNPMDKSFVSYQRALHLEKEVKKYTNVNPNTTKLKIIGKNYGDVWYGFNGNAYADLDTLKQDMRSMRSQLINQAENDLKEIAMTICPIENKNDSSWERGAQEFITGVMFAMLEDSADEELGMTREKFNLYNVAQICNWKDNNPDDLFGTLRNYFNGRPAGSKVLSLVSTAINNAPGTTKSYMGIVTTAMSLFQDDGINYITSYNDMDFDDFANKPTVLFIKVPDEKKSRHSIATMCIAQLYQILIEKANETVALALPRNVYFILDEFANLPKLNNFTELITVGRSRNIFFSMIVQSFSQLDGKYGESDAKTIRGNCNIQIYIGSDDFKTKEEFSKLCGEISIEIDKKSEGKDKKGESTGVNVSKDVVTRPLIYPDELGHVEKEHAIVKIFNEYPMKVALSHSWHCPMFTLKPLEEEYVVSKSLDYDAIRYDIVKRNNLRLGSGYGGYY